MFSPVFYTGMYAVTLDHLTEQLPQYRFRFVEVDYRNLRWDIERLKPNFLVSSASTFMSLIEPFGAHQVATKEPLLADDAVHSVASAFVVRIDSPIRALADTKGERVTATSELSFDVYLDFQTTLHSSLRICIYFLNFSKNLLHFRVFLFIIECNDRT